MTNHYETLLNKTVSRYTETTSKNDFGEDVESWNYEESGIKCRLVPISAKQKNEMPGEYEDVKYTGYFLSTQSLSTDDRIVYDSDTFRVREVYDDSSGYVRKTLLSLVP
jgi:hypothetical protein